MQHRLIYYNSTGGLIPRILHIYPLNVSIFVKTKFYQDAATWRASIDFRLSKNSHFDHFWSVFDIWDLKNIYYSASNNLRSCLTYVYKVMKVTKILFPELIRIHVYGVENSEGTVQNSVNWPRTCTMWVPISSSCTSTAPIYMIIFLFCRFTLQDTISGIK